MDKLSEIDAAANAMAEQLDTLEADNRKLWVEAEDEKRKLSLVEKELTQIKEDTTRLQLGLVEARRRGDLLETSRHLSHSTLYAYVP